MLWNYDLFSREETVTVCASLEATQKTIAIARSDAD
jgi:hypothetical protein